MFDQQSLPPNLDSIAPGPDLAMAMAGLDRRRLGGHDRVELLKARARQLAHDQAQLYADIHSVSEAIGELFGPGPLEEMFETTCSEVRTALTLTRRAAEVQVDLAFQLGERLPQVGEALNAGSIDLPRARVICDQTVHLTRGSAQSVADSVLLAAPELTTGQLRARIQRLNIAIDPASATDRYQRRLEERRVVVEAEVDGTANLLGLHLPAADANAAMRRINRLARAAKTKGDPRTIDQIRADVLLDVLAGRGQHGRGGDRGVVDIRVDLTTLAELDDAPAEIPGWGPVIADIARKISRDQDDSEWRITITDEEGQPIGVTTTRRRPTTSQRRHVEVRNPTCVFPGCRMPAGQSDLDHEYPWSETHRTTTRHLEPLCRHDHVNRHERHWRLRQIEPGVYEWTSPLGHRYLNRTEPP
jgi:hypothetical protein